MNLDTEYNESLINILKLLRVINDFKIKEVGEKVAVSPSHISRIESGEKDISAELLEKLATLYNTTSEKILEFTEISQKENLNRYEIIKRIAEYYIFENPKISQNVPKYLEKNRR